MKRSQSIRAGLVKVSVSSLLLLPVLALMAAGCSNDDTDPGQQQAPLTSIRVLHLSPDAPSVDVFANGGTAPVVESLGFLKSTGYLEIPEGTYDFEISASGQPASAAVLNVSGLMLGTGKSYTAVAYDALGAIKPLALEDDFSGLASGNIRVRAIHTAAAVGAVDIWNIPAMGDPAKLYGDVPFGGVGAYLDLPAGAYTLGFDVDKDMVPDVIFDLPALPAGTIANVFAVSDASGVYLAAQLQDGTVATIRPRS
jgi:hypothetical protein